MSWKPVFTAVHGCAGTACTARSTHSSAARRRETQRAAKRAQLLFLMRTNPQIRARKSTTEQDEAGRLVLRIDTQCFGLVYFPLEHPTGTGRTPTLQTHEG